LPEYISYKKFTHYFNENKNVVDFVEYPLSYIVVNKRPESSALYSYKKKSVYVGQLILY
jgi:hypothetical protein